MENQTSEEGNASKARWVCALILLIAILLRCYRLDLVSVTNDTAQEGLTGITAVTLEGWDWPLAGTPGEGLRDSAFFISLIAVSNILYWSPFSSAVILNGLNLLAVLLVFRFCHKRHGITAAWVAALLFATAPWSVFYSRFLIPASSLPVFCVCLLAWSLDWLEAGGRLRLAAMTAVSVAMPQLHFFGLCAFVWFLLVLAKGYRRISPAGLLIGVVVGSAVWIPWVMFQNQTEWREPQAWLNQLIRAPDAHLAALLTSLDGIWTLMTPSGFDYWFGSGVGDAAEYFPLWLRSLTAVSSVFLLAAFGFACYRTLRRPDDHGSQLLMLAWVVVPAVMGAAFAGSATMDNLQIVLPVPFMMIGIAVARLVERLPPSGRRVSTGIVLFVAMAQVLFLSGCVRMLNDGANDVTGKYQLSYAQWRPVIREVLEDSGMQPARIAGPYSGWYPAAEYVYTYESSELGIPAGRPNREICHWIDEDAPLDGTGAARRHTQKEREINLALAASLRTAPDWAIERHWEVGRSQVYRMRFVIKAPLR